MEQHICVRVRVQKYGERKREGIQVEYFGQLILSHMKAMPEMLIAILNILRLE